MSHTPFLLFHFALYEVLYMTMKINVLERLIGRPVIDRIEPDHWLRLEPLARGVGLASCRC